MKNPGELSTPADIRQSLLPYRGWVPRKDMIEKRGESQRRDEEVEGRKEKAAKEGRKKEQKER